MTTVSAGRTSRDSRVVAGAAPRRARCETRLLVFVVRVPAASVGRGGGGLLKCLVLYGRVSISCLFHSIDYLDLCVCVCPHLQTTHTLCYDSNT